MNINAFYRYYIPIYQLLNPGFQIAHGLCGNTNPPGSILNLIENSKSIICREMTEDNLTFVNSTSAIQINIPNNIYN